MIDWPSGERSELRDLEVDRLHRVTEEAEQTAHSEKRAARSE